MSGFKDLKEEKGPHIGPTGVNSPVVAMLENWQLYLGKDWMVSNDVKKEADLTETKI